MVLLIVALVLAVPLLWAVSVGALRDARRAREVSPREGCQAWVQVRGLPARRYRCGAPVYAGGRWCLRHERQRPGAAPDPSDDVTFVDEPQAVGRALVQARIGVPLAAAFVLGLIALLIWVLQRAG